MDSSKLQAIKDQLKFYTTSYATPGVVSPNAIQPQLVLDLIDEIERLSAIHSGLRVRADFSNDNAQHLYQGTAPFDAERNDLQEEIRDLKTETDKLYAEVRTLQADLVAARKGTAKKKTP